MSPDALCFIGLTDVDYCETNNSEAFLINSKYQKILESC